MPTSVVLAGYLFSTFLQLKSHVQGGCLINRSYKQLKNGRVAARHAFYTILRNSLFDLKRMNSEINRLSNCLLLPQLYGICIFPNKQPMFPGIIGELNHT